MYKSYRKEVNLLKNCNKIFSEEEAKEADDDDDDDEAVTRKHAVINEIPTFDRKEPMKRAMYILKSVCLYVEYCKHYQATVAI